MRVLVTGHLGYIGAVLTRLLKQRGHHVVGLDTGYFDREVEGSDFKPDSEIRADIRKVPAASLDGIDTVAHLAALSDDPSGQLNAKLTDDINRAASVDLALKARDAGVRRFAFSSSCSMYGATEDGVVCAEDSPFNPITAYAKSKVEAEAEIRKMANGAFSPVFLRNATAFGASPRIRMGTLVVHNLMGWAITTGKVLIKSDGSPWRPLVHVEDIARAFVCALEAPQEAVHNEAFNVGQNEENYQVKEIAEVVKDVVPGSVLEITGEVQDDRRSYRVSFDKIRDSLPGFEPVWNLRSGAEDLLGFLRSLGLTEELFQSRQFVRLSQLQHLIDTRAVDMELYWSNKGGEG